MYLFYRFGAGIKIDVIMPSTVYNQLTANPQCPFLYEDTGAIPENWTEVCYVTMYLSARACHKTSSEEVATKAATEIIVIFYQR